jgi:ORF6N domain
MLDADLAGLYGVETRVLLQALKRNRRRFPEDFVFQLTTEDLSSLRSQIVISKPAGARVATHLRSQIVTSNAGRGGPPLPSLRLHRARRRDAFQRAAQLARGRGEHRDYANICATPTVNGQQRRSRAQDRRSRKEIRRTVRSRVRGD